MQPREKKVIAIVGMCGSGKTEVVNYLMKKYRWPKVYLPEALFDEIEKAGLEVNWENEEKMRVGLRQEHGKSVFAKLSVPKIEKELERSDVVLVESLYGWGEYKIIKKTFPKFFKVIAINASPALRFERLQNREIRPIKTFKEFHDRDVNEIEVTEKGGPIAIADYTLINEGSMEKLYRKIDKVIAKEGTKEIFN